MKVPVQLIDKIRHEFEPLIAQFLTGTKRVDEPAQLRSKRWLTRSIVPHIERLSHLFNRLEADSQGDAIDRYWHQGSNPDRLRLAYFLYFMPANLFRAASVACELSRLGFRFRPRPDGKPLRAVDFGAGPASLSSGFAYSEKFAPLGLGTDLSWALIEQDRKVLELGVEWSRALFENLEWGWETRSFHRKIDFSRPLLPKTAPEFDLWTHSFFSNESDLPVDQMADRLIEAWSQHLSDEGVAILIEPALKAHSRNLLLLRQHLIERFRKNPELNLKIMLPCLGEQACGALAEKEDWCHEEAIWFRPPYYRMIDDLASLDRKTLPFSYLIVAKSARPLEELLPKLAKGEPQSRYRLVSPPHSEGKDLEFFVCGQEGKRRVRHRPTETEREEELFHRGTILSDVQMQGDRHSSIITRTSRLRIV